jgi:hypothetical protein
MVPKIGGISGGGTPTTTAIVACGEVAGTNSRVYGKLAGKLAGKLPESYSRRMVTHGDPGSNPGFTPRQHLHVVSRGAVASFPVSGLVS